MTSADNHTISKKVSVIIPSFNSYKTISRTIEGIQKQTAIQSILEVIVVDSSDDTITHEFLKSKEDSTIKVIRSGYKIIPSIQRNIGAKMARGDLLCFIDSDAYPGDNWIGQILLEYNRGYLAGGGSYAVPDFQKDLAIAYAQYFLEFSEYIGYGEKRYQDIVASCNIFCDRKLFLRVGGFPEVRASEDSLFCLKVNREERMIFLPKAIVYHIFRESKDHFLSNQKMLGKYIYYFRRRSYSGFYYKGIFPYVFFPAFMLFKFIRIFFRVMRTDFSNFKRFLKALPLFIRGMNSWGKGFLTGIKEYRNIDKEFTV